MKIAFIGQKGIPATYGGIERYVEELSTRLADRGHAVWVYVRNYYTPGTDTIYKGVYLVRIPTIRSKHLDTLVHVFLSTLDLIRRDVDIIYVHAVGPSALIPLMRLLKPRAKVISVFQSRDDLHAKWGRFARFCLRIGTWFACKMPHATVTSSKILHQYAMEKYHADTVQIYNGAPSPKELHGNEMEQKLGITQGSYFLMVTRFVRHKNIHKVIRAFKNLKTDKKLVIAGGAVYTDKYYQEIQELAKGDDRIILPGVVSGNNLWELYQKAYAFVQASGSEGMPLAVLEAMSFGCGIIASDIKEHYEVLEEAALYFDVNSVSELTALMGLALTQPQSLFEKGTLARQRARNVFSWERITDQVEWLFETVINDPESVKVFSEKIR